jgi:hypothetical protein
MRAQSGGRGICAADLGIFVSKQRAKDPLQGRKAQEVQANSLKTKRETQNSGY